MSGLGLGCAKTQSDLVVMPCRRRIFTFACTARDHRPQNYWCDALTELTQGADLAGSWLQGPCDRVVVRRFRAGENAARDRRAPQRRNRHGACRCYNAQSPLQTATEAIGGSAEQLAPSLSRFGEVRTPRQ